MSKLILVRHGESEYNKLGIWTGLKDPDLTEQGRLEAHKAGYKLASTAIHAAFSSELKRSINTGKIVLGFHMDPPPLIQTTALNERDYGVFTEKSKKDVLEEYGEEKFQLIRRSWDHPIEDGNTLKDVHAVVAPFHHQTVLPILAEDRNVAIFSHNNTLRAYVKEVEAIPTSDVGNIELGTAEVRIYTYDQDLTIIDTESHVIGAVH